MDTTTHWVILPPCICMCFHASLHSWMVSSKVYGLRVCHRSHPQSRRFVIVHTQHTSLLRVWSPEHSKNCVLCGNALSFCDTIKSTTTTTTNLEKMALSHFFYPFSLMCFGCWGKFADFNIAFTSNQHHHWKCECPSDLRYCSVE